MQMIPMGMIMIVSHTMCVGMTMRVPMPVMFVAVMIMCMMSMAVIVGMMMVMMTRHGPIAPPVRPGC